MRKSLGDKRREIPRKRADEILALRKGFTDCKQSKIYPTTHFGFRKITVERPLNLNFQASPERIPRLDEERGFANLAVSKKKDRKVKAKEEAEGRAEQKAIRDVLASMPDRLYLDREAFLEDMKKAAKAADVKLAASVQKAIHSALSERDDNAEVCRDKDGNPEADSDLRDCESVPLSETVEEYFEREVKPHVPDAWIDTDKRDPRDGEAGMVGYEINFNRYFYEYTPPRPLEEDRSGYPGHREGTSCACSRRSRARGPRKSSKNELVTAP